MSMISIRLLVGLMACTGIPVSVSCPIKMSPTAVVVKYGDPFSANCTLSSDEPIGLGWESSQGGTGVKRVSNLSLIVDSVTDLGIRPHCYAYYRDGNQCQQLLPVTIYKMPESVSMSQLSPKGTMIEGEKYRMQCDVIDVAPVRYLSVYWYKGNEIVHKETFEGHSESKANKSSFLDLFAHGLDDGSQVWCEAKLDLPMKPDLPAVKSQSHNMVVLYPPTFINPDNETQEVRPNDKITFNCTATGNPAPKYKWLFPHRIQSKDKDLETNQPSLTPSLLLPGTYSCLASNTRGSNIKYFTITELPRDYTTLAAMVGGIASLGVLGLIMGYFVVTPQGTFSFSQGSYQPTSSAPV